MNVFTSMVISIAFVWGLRKTSQDINMGYVIPSWIWVVTTIVFSVGLSLT